MNTITALWARGVVRILRNRAAVISATFIPGIFLVCFYSVFSDATAIFGIDYATFLFPAAVMQVIIFTAGGSALEVALDHENGIHARLATMSIHPSQIVTGRLLADTTRAIISGGIVTAVAAFLGAGVDDGVWRIGVVFLIFLLLTLAFCAGFCGLSLLGRKPTSTALLIQSLVMPFIIFSTAFIPAEALSSSVRPFITHMPLSPILDSVRVIMTGSDLDRGTTIEAAVWLVVLAILAIIGFSAAFSKERK
ncbi:ABC transporter permease [Corynebacterium sp. CCM 9203]|uniref:ABC transporter permease n=1 Tax=Corynebacterium sp. CCM 9203 TaxID=3057615 RepID=UPI0035252DBC